MTVSTSCLGIHQSALILQSAIRAAFEDLRAKPYLLDYAFGGLAQDTLTAGEYGGAEIERAKQWFLSNDIKVFIATRTNQVTFPCVSLKVLSSNEAENTIGDIHYEPQEDADLAWPVLSGPFDAIRYEPSTGKLTIPQPDIITAPNQVVVARSGNAYTVRQTPDRTTLVLDKGLREDFAQMTVRGQKPSFVTSLGSAEFVETVMLGCHAQSEPIYAIYLHSLVVFSLLMYRASLLEARNFERTSIQSTGEGEREQDLKEELVYSRYLQLTGYVRQMWPRAIAPRVTAVETQPRITDAGRVAPGTELDAPWLGDEDGDGLVSLMRTPRK